MGKSSKAQRLRYADQCKHEQAVVVKEYVCQDCGASLQPGRRADVGRQAALREHGH